MCLIVGTTLCPWRSGLVLGHSMEPTLTPGSVFIYDQSYYRHHPLRAGDVVVIRHDGAVWVKRVYAVEGDSFWTYRLRLQDGEVRRDPIAPGHQDRFAQLAAYERVRHRADVGVRRLRVPLGAVFVVGDSARSDDSRTRGPFDRAAILGRVVALPGQRLDVAPDAAELAFPTPGNRRLR
jgi:signal peptidase I